ncbi:hypothetical protein TVAG_262030 [Trichomonas vaginalis G3]|uniref:Uncharacterized protein n=1 Tax=Trichomonas vaginalis (strain ATCC PRA-98 / G3) TaxID=412133 RepID=A2DUB5_TRIV3|nr:WD40 repeat-like family [Trichomonas vaginalis G3]EAY15953.1 hypothetical protein TVAG_262030 [Trichomonas vaginalis G3]KAI5523587.1 WD40 repeat-like family [Trichomonas vaginalis G3]|eukprot:XP_001328176.1 hypothetical protein [Trichomonas vaginalis G3]
MSVEAVKLSPTSVSIGCHRRRIAFEGDTAYYTDGNNLIKNGSEIIYTSKSPIYDILRHDDKFLTIDSKGLVTLHSGENSLTNSINGYSGIFSAIEKTANNIIAAHDLSHTVRIIDPSNLQTINTINAPGIPNGLSAFDNNTFVFTDDRTINVVDSRLDQIERSAVLSSQPVAIYCHDSMIIVACDDRRIRIFDSRRLRTATTTTKPASKNGTAALWTLDNECIAAIGFDEGMTLVEPSKDVGQFKRCKFLAETPFVSAPTVTEKGFAVLTRGGMMYNITDPVAFLRSQKEGAEDDADGE